MIRKLLRQLLAYVILLLAFAVAFFDDAPMVLRIGVIVSDIESVLRGGATQWAAFVLCGCHFLAFSLLDRRSITVTFWRSGIERVWVAALLLLSGLQYAFCYSAASSSTNALALVGCATIGKGAGAWERIKIRKAKAESGDTLANRVVWVLVALLVFAPLWRKETGWGFEYRGQARWTGPWDNPNVFGMLMAVGIVLAMGKLLSIVGRHLAHNEKSKVQSLRSKVQGTWVPAMLFSAAAIVCGIGLVKSYSRGAWVAATVAFTLIELLVVIAIIGVLAALLMPAMSGTKAKAEGAYCMNNGKQLAAALHMYAGDFNDWLPPNPEDRESTNHWVEGNFWHNLGDATNILYLTDPKHAKLAPYSGRSAGIYKCPADRSMVAIEGIKYPRVRTFSMNQAVGTKSLPPPEPVDAPWLDGKNNTGRYNKHNQPWRTYGKFSDMLAPLPSALWVFLDEEERSINDAGFAVDMTLPTHFQDWPGTYHNLACGFAFADGHSEIHKWTDGNTRLSGSWEPRHYTTPPVRANNPDVLWLQERTSSRATPAEPQSPR